jgi:acetyltransferase-like isoleucine patch superfamily enzyme
LIEVINKWCKGYYSVAQHEWILAFQFRIRMYVAYFRGFIARFGVKVNSESKLRKLLLGSRVELLIRPGSKIVLKKYDIDDSIKASPYNPLFPEATTIGARPHYKNIDPPCVPITRIELLNQAKLMIGQNVMILPGTYITGSNNAVINIDSNSYISHEVKINARNLIWIGKNVLIGYQTMIMDYDGHTIICDNKKNKSPQIVIKDNVWIGCKVTILKGVTIGEGSIIGANSCVVSDVPPNTMVAGNPAKIIKSNVSWER